MGRGSFATVFEALDTRTGHRLAAKKVPKCRPSRLAEEQTAAVAAEAATQAALAAASTHHVLQLVDVRQSASHFYLISELCCCDLASYLSGRLSPCTEREAGHIAAQLLSALAACHRAGVAYRDVKPANLCVRSVDANGLPAIVLADFGCSRSVSAHGSGDRASAGTPLYSAPECMQGSGGMEGDVWGAGVLLYSLLSGTFPFCDPRTFNITQGASAWLSVLLLRPCLSAPLRSSLPASLTSHPLPHRLQASTGAAWPSSPSTTRAAPGSTSPPAPCRCCGACSTATAASASAPLPRCKTPGCWPRPLPPATCCPARR